MIYIIQVKCATSHQQDLCPMKYSEHMAGANKTRMALTLAKAALAQWAIAPPAKSPRGRRECRASSFAQGSGYQGIVQRGCMPSANTYLPRLVAVRPFDPTSRPWGFTSSITSVEHSCRVKEDYKSAALPEGQPALATQCREFGSLRRPKLPTQGSHVQLLFRTDLESVHPLFSTRCRMLH